ncbi:MAG: chemotaxis response regulator protein-glutamate methylesterase [Candidatus Dadabacteria bacterium]|nr:MAG: chemotaxis response regulator protein-glutamate methylesterase [Candidatus Dadabacteria bacterium]
MTLADPPVRVLVVDDTIVYRKIVSDALAEIPGVEVVGTAANGKIALARAQNLLPDLLTLDLEMPVMDGLEVLRRLPEVCPNTAAIMVSTLTQRGGALTMRALELGALDFVPKPQEASAAVNRAFLRAELEKKIEVFRARRNALVRPRRSTRPAPRPRTAPAEARAWQGADVVAVGVSTGGPNALARLLPGFPADFGVPILVVQHMPPMFTASLAESLDRKCPLEVREARDGERVEPGRVLIAPGGFHLKVVAGVDGLSRILRLTRDPPEHAVRPAVDYLFRSVAQHFAGRAVGVVMTGMGRDGTEGLTRMKQNGCRTLVQDEATSVVWGMPGSAVEAGVADRVVPLDRLAEEIGRAVKPGPWGAGREGGG